MRNQYKIKNIIIMITIIILLYGVSTNVFFAEVSQNNEKIKTTSLEFSDVNMVEKNIYKNITMKYKKNEYDMVVIAPNIFSEELEPLINHKNNIGIRSFIKTTDEIYIEYEGYDHAEQIKYFIKDAVESWNITYVLLVGDMTILPMRKSMVEWNYLGLTLTRYVYTDLYYGDVFDANGDFCSWDSNNNKLFGEYKWTFVVEDDFSFEYIDKVDLYPDVGVGRLPCRSLGELDTVIKKIITYEQNSYGEYWFKRILLMGGDTFPNEGVVEGEFISKYIYSIIKEFGFEPTWLLASQNRFKPSIINEEWSKGAGFISFSGHGGTFQIATYSTNKNIMNRYFIPYLLNLKNENRLPIIFLDACDAGSPESSLFGFHFPCFAWATLMYPKGGSVGVIGNTAYGYTTIMDEEIIFGASLLNILFFDSYEEGIILSDMFTDAQEEYLNLLPWKDCLTIEGYNLFGDPSLKIGGYS